MRKAVLATVIGGGGLGPELASNGGFDADANWTKGTGWTIAAGVVAGANVAAGANLTHITAAVAAGRSYLTSFTITAYTSGGVSFQLGAAATGLGAIRISAATFTETITTTTSGTLAFVRRTSNFTGSIDNVSVREILT